MSATTMTNYKMWKSHKLHSNHALSSRQEADDSAQRDYKRPIYSQKLITNDYDRGDDGNDK